MASDTNAYFGFELLTKLEDSHLNKKEEVIILLLHWYLVKNSFKCIGLGDLKTFDPASDVGSELLPPEWNLQANYSLRYIKERQLYIIIALKSDDDLLINFLRTDNNCVSNIQFPIETTVASLHGPLDTLIPSHRSVVEKIRKELVEPVYTGTAREISTQTAQQSRHSERRHDPDDDPLRVERCRRQPRRPRYPTKTVDSTIYGPFENPLSSCLFLPRGADIVPKSFIIRYQSSFPSDGKIVNKKNPELDPRNVGRADLDPFGLGGGMIYDPFTPQRGIPNPLDPRGPGGLGMPGILPPGAVPPGARFDPFGPPDVNIPRCPDRDHLPPPGYDDMFM